MIGSGGKISQHSSSQRQIRLLRKEGIDVDHLKIDLEEFQWKPSKKEVRQILKGLPRHVSIFLR